MNDTLLVWDVPAGKRPLAIPVERTLGSYLAVSPDGRVLVSSPATYPTVNAMHFWDIRTGRRLLTADPGDDRPLSLAFSADSHRLLTGMNRGSALVWETAAAYERLRARE